MEDKKLVLKACPFCGQMCMAGPEDDLRKVCKCEGATHWRLQCEHRDRLYSAIDKLFGDDCRTYSPEYQPLSEEELADLHSIAEMVAFGRIGTVSAVVHDGSKIVIGEKVRRTLVVKQEEAQ